VHKYLFKLVRGTILLFALEDAIHTFSAVNLSKKVSIYKIIVEVKYDYLNVMCSNGLSVGRPVTFRCHGPVELENKEYLW
jgi:hypothetical protein